MWQRKVLVMAAVCIGKPPPLFGPVRRGRRKLQEHIYDRRCDRQSTDPVRSAGTDFSRLHDSVQRPSRDIRAATPARMVKKIFSVRRQGVRVKSILDRSFHYTPSAQTDLKKTFARIRRRNQDEGRSNEATQDGNGGVTMDGFAKAMNSGHVRKSGQSY